MGQKTIAGYVLMKCIAEFASKDAFGLIPASELAVLVIERDDVDGRKPGVHGTTYPQIGIQRVHECTRELARILSHETTSDELVKAISESAGDHRFMSPSRGVDRKCEDSHRLT